MSFVIGLLCVSSLIWLVCLVGLFVWTRRTQSTGNPFGSVVMFEVLAIAAGIILGGWLIVLGVWVSSHLHWV